MERRFCGQCGKPIGECTCNKGIPANSGNMGVNPQANRPAPTGFPGMNPQQPGQYQRPQQQPGQNPYQRPQQPQPGQAPQGYQRPPQQQAPGFQNPNPNQAPQQKPASPFENPQPKAPSPFDAPERSERKVTDFGAVRSAMEKFNERGDTYLEKLDNIELAHGEVIVRQYNVGKFVKMFGIGHGSATIIVTNKRIISKADTNYLLTSSNMLEEVSLKDVIGVKNYYAQGITKWRLMGAIYSFIAWIMALIMAFQEGGAAFLLPLIVAGIMVYFIVTMRRPSYLFHIYCSAINTAMVTGVNLRGKLMNSAGYGIIFQYKPTRDAVKMISELGACITDLKERGDAAIDTWKNR